MNDASAGWTIDDARALYGIDHWGAGMFSISPRGEVCLVPDADDDVCVPIPRIIAGARQRGYDYPLLLRVENFLDQRLTALYRNFREAIAHSGYQGGYTGVYPVKVNQQHAVIEEICRFGSAYGHGLEAGSKAELLLCLSNLEEGGLLICNGYKDREFIDLGLWATRLGYRCFFVVESAAELPLIIARSQALQIRPLLGLRIKVSAMVSGLWTETSGDRSSFGLSTAQLVTAVDHLREAQLDDCLQLLHCHLGSQIPDLAEIAAGVREASRFYADLAAEGLPLRYLDLGGGLAVDYLGTQSRHSHSRNYSLADYCRALTETIRDTLDSRGIAHPQILTESGRATVAHSSLLVFNVLDVMRYSAEPPGTLDLPDEAHPLLRQQHQLCRQTNDADPRHCYREALQTRDAIREAFRQGEIPMRERALAEDLFLSLCLALRQRRALTGEFPPEMSGLDAALADIYYGNFSVFQSLPDTWAIDQVFPVMPLQRLTEKPCRDASIADLTCDCDGKLDRFILGAGEGPTLPLHPLKPNEDYLLGVFLMGAYQETLGDLHNLFGDTNVLSIRIDKDGGFSITHEQAADTIAEVLAMLEYNPGTLQRSFRDTLERAVRRGTINAGERRRILDHFTARLHDQTYFSSPRDAAPD